MIGTPVGNAQQEQMHGRERERERGACCGEDMTHNEVGFLERDNVAEANMQTTENAPDFLKKELSMSLAITIPLI